MSHGCWLLMIEQMLLMLSNNVDDFAMLCQSLLTLYY